MGNSSSRRSNTAVTTVMNQNNMPIDSVKRNTHFLVKDSDYEKIKDNVSIIIQTSTGFASGKLKIKNTEKRQLKILNNDTIYHDYKLKQLLVRSNGPLGVLFFKTFYLKITGSELLRGFPRGFPGTDHVIATDQFNFKIVSTTYEKLKLNSININCYWYSSYMLFIYKFDNNSNNSWNQIQSLFSIPNLQLFIPNYGMWKGLYTVGHATVYGYTKKFSGNDEYLEIKWYLASSLESDETKVMLPTGTREPHNIVGYVRGYASPLTFRYAAKLNAVTNIEKIIKVGNEYTKIPDGTYTCILYDKSSSRSDKNNNNRVVDNCYWIPRLPYVINESVISYFDNDIPFINVPPTEEGTYTLIELDKPFDVQAGKITISPIMPTIMPDLEPTGIIKLQDNRQGVYCQFWGIEDTQKKARRLLPTIEYSAAQIDDLNTKLVGIF